jgi:uncharacterized RDD family membrane protein YckC
VFPIGSFSLFSQLMAIITVGTPFNIDLEFKIAAFKKRLLAWTIDIFVICVYYYLMLRFIYPLLGMSEAIQTAAALFGIILPVLLYQLLFELFFNGQTLGKKLAGIAVIDIEGKEPSWGQYIIRWALCIGNFFIYVIPYLLFTYPGLLLIFLATLYLPDFLSIIISARSQRLGDFAAGTVVIDRKYRPDISETIYQEIENKHYKPMFPQVMRLTDRDINGIRNLIHTRRPGKDMEQYTERVVEKIKSVLSIESHMPAIDFLEQLMRDYNYYTSINNANGQ